MLDREMLSSPRPFWWAPRSEMDFLTWRDVDLGGVVLAGLIAGYVMALVGLWAGSIPGLVAIDIADFGRRYMVSDRSSAWLLGMVSHLANSIILVLLWASAVEPNLEWPRWLEGLVWGEALAIALAGALVAPLSGHGFMGSRTGDLRFGATNLTMHGVWGLLTGLIYTGAR